VTVNHQFYRTEVRACLSTAWSSAEQDGQENWYVDESAMGLAVASAADLCTRPVQGLKDS